MKYLIEYMGKQKYITITADENEVHDGFACNMMSEADVPGQLQLYYAPVDDKNMYKYNITDLICMEDYVTTITDPMVLANILTQIVEIYENVESYILNQEGLIYSKRFIYMDVNREKVSMIYVPIIRRSVNAEEAFRSLILDMLKNSSVELDERGEHAISCITDYLMLNAKLDIEVMKNMIADLYPIVVEEVPVFTEPVQPKKRRWNLLKSCAVLN